MKTQPVKQKKQYQTTFNYPHSKGETPILVKFYTDGETVDSDDVFFSGEPMGVTWLGNQFFNQDYYREQYKRMLIERVKNGQATAI